MHNIPLRFEPELLFNNIMEMNMTILNNNEVNEVEEIQKWQQFCKKVGVLGCNLEGKPT